MTQNQGERITFYLGAALVAVAAWGLWQLLS